MVKSERHFVMSLSVDASVREQMQLIAVLQPFVTPLNCELHLLCKHGWQLGFALIPGIALIPFAHMPLLLLLLLFPLLPQASTAPSAPAAASTVVQTMCLMRPSQTVPSTKGTPPLK
jgi:hypothetical protein